MWPSKHIETATPASLAGFASDAASQASEDPGRYALPPSDFDLGKTPGEFARRRASPAGIDPLGVGGSPLDAEVEAQISQLERKARTPLSRAEKTLVADTIRGIRKGGWMDALKPTLVGKDSVGMEYWNRLVAEHEYVIAKVAQRNVEANQKLSDQQEETAKLRQASNIQTPEGAAGDADRLRKELADTKEALNAVRGTAGKQRLEIAELRQQKSDGLRREQALKDQVIGHQESKPVAKNDSDGDGDGDEDDDDLKALRARVSTLVSQLDLERKTSEATCADLRAARDRYRGRWARSVAANGVNSRADLVEFWEAVDATNAEISQLYQSIQTLSRALDMPGPYVDMPETLDRIVREVTGPEAHGGRSLSLTVLNLRCSLNRSRLQLEVVQGELERRRHDSTAEPAGAQREKVATDEVRKQVEARTQNYRNFRREFLDHIFEAQARIMALAEKSNDRSSLEAVVAQYLHPSKLPLPALGLA